MEAHGLRADRKIAPQAKSDPAPAVFARRTIDLTVALLLLILAAPLMVAIALAVRIEGPGPAIYRQRRHGLRRGTFTLYKFRTMRPGADSSVHRRYVRTMIERGSAATVGGDNLYKLAVDDRITRVGRVLRRFSCDELPQLWNVVRGQMSLVGPRPAIPYEVECYPAWYHARFRVKPGMTGLWQVSGRSERTYEEMVRLDIAYATSRTLWLDLRILARTARVVASARGAA